MASRKSRPRSSRKRHGNSSLGFNVHLKDMWIRIDQAWRDIGRRDDSRTSSEYVAADSARDTMRDVLDLHREAIDRKIVSDKVLAEFLLDRLKYMKMRTRRDLSLRSRDAANKVIAEVTKLVRKQLLS